MTVKKYKRKYICIDISGTCNAQCPYCVTGARHHPNAGFIEPEKFRQILNKINRLYPQSHVYLYNWGEPLLHPEYPSLIEEFNKYPNIQYGISTNAGIYKNITAEMAQSCAIYLFSMCGFSQQSYDKIHKLSFETVKTNICKTVEAMRKLNDEVVFRLAFHIYRFNTDEITPAKKFAEELNIEFNPYYAFINDLEASLAYHNGTMPAAERERLEKDIFVDKFYIDTAKKEKIKKEGKFCPGKFILTIDPSGQILLGCCAPFNNQNYVYGEFLSMSKEEIAKTEFQPLKVCSECLHYELPLLKHDPVKY